MRRLFVGLVAAAGVAAGAALFAPRPAPPVGPRARFPDAVDLGERKPGEVAVAQFPIHNPGDRPLVVSGITATCSCAGLEADENGRRLRVTEATVPPGATAPLFFQVSVAADPGRPQTVWIKFRTNDPAVPAADVPATVSRVVGRPFARPSAVTLGAVRVGQPRSEVIDLLPNATAGVRAVRVTSSRPDLVSASLEPPAGADPAEPGGAAVARVRVTAVAAGPADLDAEVTVGVVTDGLPPQEVRVSVTGRVRHPVECLPSRALVPVGGGCTLHLVGADARPFTATVVAVPDGLTAAVAAEPPLAGRSQARLTLTRTPGGQPTGGPVRLAIVPADAPPFELEVPVSCPAP